MTVELRRYGRLIRPTELTTLLSAPDTVQVEALDLPPVNLDAIRELVSTLQAEGAERATWDARMVEQVHRDLRLPRAVAGDMRSWHWLSVGPAADIVWARWNGTVPGSAEEIAEAVTGPISERFLGTSSLRGVSRNALARLWWCGESLYSEEDGYSLAREALARQDLFQNVFERMFGLFPPAARACVRTYKDASEAEWRAGTRRLNRLLTTTVVESLSEDDIVALLAA